MIRPANAVITTQVATGARGMVVAGHPLATAAGVDILAGGGNAVDAAIAAAAVLTVACPYACGLGGDAYLLIFHAASGQTFGLNGTGRSPAAATPSAYAGGIPANGIRSVSVPGMVAGWQAAADRCGTRPLAALLAPAIRLADNGVEINRQLARNTAQRAALLAGNAEASSLFLPDGAPLREGGILRQADLAVTLRRIAKHGAREYYDGETGAAIVRAMEALGGPLSVDDLRHHATLWQAPISAPFAGFDIATMPPNSYGLTLLLQLLALESEGMADVDPDSAEFTLRGIAARRRAYDAASAVIGDPEELEAPSRELLQQARQGSVASGISVERREGGTSNVVVMDGRGNAVSLIQSVSAPYGAGVVVPDTGILLNNRMRGFNTDPAHPNCVVPRKRPAHTLAPCLVLRDGEVWMSVGTPGAAGQTCTLAQFLTRALAMSQNVPAAIAAPRWSVDLQGVPILEADMPAKTRTEVKRLEPAAEVKETGWLTFGSVKVTWRDGGVLRGAADGRRSACAAGV